MNIHKIFFITLIALSATSCLTRQTLKALDEEIERSETYTLEMDYSVFSSIARVASDSDTILVTMISKKTGRPVSFCLPYDNGKPFRGWTNEHRCKEINLPAFKRSQKTYSEIKKEIHNQSGDTYQYIILRRSEKEDDLEIYENEGTPFVIHGNTAIVTMHPPGCGPALKATGYLFLVPLAFFADAFASPYYLFQYLKAKTKKAAFAGRHIAGLRKPKKAFWIAIEINASLLPVLIHPFR